jgi:hypothetical protein
MVMQDKHKDFIQVRPLWGRNTYVLRQIVLLCILRCDEMRFEGVPCPSYIVRGAGLHVWKLICLVTIVIAGRIRIHILTDQDLA